MALTEKQEDVIWFKLKDLVDRSFEDIVDQAEDLGLDFDTAIDWTKSLFRDPL